MLNGFDVAFVAFENGKPAGKPEVFVGGFADKDNNARGRPEGVAFDNKGALYIADDVGNVVWRVAAEPH